jgi:hypothetical protein
MAIGPERFHLPPRDHQRDRMQQALRTDASHNRLLARGGVTDMIARGLRNDATSEREAGG